MVMYFQIQQNLILFCMIYKKSKKKRKTTTDIAATAA